MVLISADVPSTYAGGWRPGTATESEARSRVFELVVACALAVAVALVLASPATATFPRLNGSIAFLRFNPGAEIVAVDLSGGVVFQSPYFGPSDYDPAWSPDGRWLAFSRTGGAGDGLYVSDAWGGHVRRLTRGDDEDPSWAPSGDKLVYGRSSARESVRGIWAVTFDGTDARRIVAGTFGKPSWSPEGELIAFSEYGGGTFLVRPDGSGLQQILSVGFAPNWAPDGSQFTYDGGGDFGEVWVAGRDGTDPHRITGGNNDLWPTWSPDGKWIAFSREDFDTRDHNVHVVRTDGSGLRRVTHLRESDDLGVDWQPLRCTQTGTSGPDRLLGTPAPDVLCGQGGDNTLRAVGRNDILVGSGGDDLLLADGRTLLFGGSGNDRLLGGRSSDVLVGGFGADLLRGRGRNDLLSGGAGPDGIYGGPGSDRLFGGSGRDSLSGGRGRDRLFSRDRQRDWLDGGPDSDCALADPPRVDKVKNARRCTLRQLQGLVR
jgi:Tol biopolymer transport system component